MSDPTSTLPAPYQPGSLKPCPFCAYPVKLETIRHRVGYYYEIQCTNAMCGTSMWDEEKEDLITKWNRRVQI